MRVPEIMPCALDFPNVIAPQSSAAQPRIRVTFHSGHDGLLGLREIWGDLLTRLPHARFFHEWVWYRAYLQHLELAPENVSFALLVDSGGPLAIVPLQKTSISFHGVTSRLWRLPEHTHMPLADVIAAQGVSGAELVAALLAAMRTQGMHWDRVQFTGFTEESCLNCAALADGRALHRDVLTSSDQVVCNLPWEVFARRFSPNFRSNLNKARHKIERAGGATYEVTNDPARVEALFPEFLRVEASGWKGASGTRTAIACDPRAVEFYRSLMESWEPSGRVFINVMHFAGRVIGSQFCVCDTDTVFILKLGYDESFAHVGPGNSLLEQLVRWCYASPNLHKINLAGKARWFQDWHPEPNNVYRVHLFNRTPIGQIHRIKCAARAQLRLLAGARHRRAQNTERAAAPPRG